MNTAQKIFETVQALDEKAAQEVLDFAEFLRQKLQPRLTEGESLVDLMNQLSDLPSFKGDPLAIQKALRDEWR